MYRYLIAIPLISCLLHASGQKTEYLIGAHYGEFKAASEIDAANLESAYGAKIGMKEGLGVVALEYNYVQPYTKDGIQREYQSLLILLDGMTKPKKFIGSLNAQMSVGIHAGVLQSDIEDESSRGFIYGAQGGMVFPLTKWLLFEAIYRYSLTNVTASGIKTDALQQLNFGASFVF